MTRPDEALAPSRRLRRSAGPLPSSAPIEEEEIARGMSDAVLGALGRMQLKLDLLAREQTERFAQLEAKIDALQASMDEFVVETEYVETEPEPATPTVQASGVAADTSGAYFSEG